MFWLYEITENHSKYGFFSIDGNSEIDGMFLSKKLATKNYIKKHGSRLEIEGWIKVDLFSKKIEIAQSWNANFENITYCELNGIIKENWKQSNF